MPRAKSYDRKTVLLEAMLVFWAKGYERASIAELEKAMGINRFSIYDAFGDKKGLFLACIETYGEEISKRQTACLLEPGGAAGVQKFFDDLLLLLSGNSNQGCLVINTLVDLSGQDSDIDDAITANLRFVEERMYKVARSALASGAFVSAESPRTLARQLLSVTQTVLAFSKSTHGHPIARAAVAGLLSSLLPPAPSRAKSRAAKVAG